MRKIGNPLSRMHEMFDYIQHVTNSLRSTLKAETEKVQANTYLITSEKFEMAFNHHHFNYEGEVDQNAICQEMYRTLQQENLVKERQALEIPSTSQIIE